MDKFLGLIGTGIAVVTNLTAASFGCGTIVLVVGGFAVMTMVLGLACGLPMLLLAGM